MLNSNDDFNMKLFDPRRGSGLRMDSLSLELFKKDWLFALGCGLSRDEQTQLMELCLKEGGKTGRHPLTGDLMWVGYLARQPDPKKVNYLVPEESEGRWSYLIRYEENLGWHWTDPLVESIISRFLMRFQGLYKSITRVNILLQRPGYALVQHRDLRAGEIYPDLKRPEINARGNLQMRYAGEKWFIPHAEQLRDGIHREQKYLTLKIPLSEKDNSPGAPFIVVGEKKFHYNSCGQAFFINEVEILHGGDPVDFNRGVVFIDGILNLDVLGQVYKAPIALEEALQ